MGRGDGVEEEGIEIILPEIVPELFTSNEAWIRKIGFCGKIGLSASKLYFKIVCSKGADLLERQSKDQIYFDLHHLNFKIAWSS